MARLFNYLIPWVRGYGWGFALRLEPGLVRCYGQGKIVVRIIIGVSG